MSTATDLAYYQTRLTAIRAALTKTRNAVSVREGDLSIQREYQTLLNEERWVLGKIQKLEAATTAPRGARSRNIVPW